MTVCLDRSAVGAAARAHLWLALLLALGLALGYPPETRSDAGATNPQELLEKVRGARGPDELIPLAVPEQRLLLTMLFGVVPTTMMLGFLESGGDGVEAIGLEPDADTKSEVAQWRAEWDALLARYEIDLAALESASSELQKVEGDDAFLRASRPVLESALGHIDAPAFVRESMELLRRHSDDPSAPTTADYTGARLSGERESLHLVVPGAFPLLDLAVREGIWYLDFRKRDGD